MSLEDATVAANKAMSMTRMEESKVSNKKRVMAEKDREIVEYIKYLIGKTVNNDFELRRADFK